MTLRIAVDAMGGDHAPASIVEGAATAAREYGHRIVLVGIEKTVRAELDRLGANDSSIDVVHAEEVVGMNESAVTSLRRKKRSSIRVAAQLLKSGDADAFVSAGNTGAVMANLKVTLGLLDGVDRPALAAVLPNLHSRSVWLDVGANVAPRPAHLVQFAVMGSLYSSRILGASSPRVGLLSIGEEEGKGNDATREVARRLRLIGDKINFIGNVEGRDIFSGRADVIVCDGFIGNVSLKAIEAVTDTVRTFLRQEIEKSWWARLGSLLMGGAFERFKNRVSYEEYGGVPLLGMSGATIICHGRSSPRAIQNAIRVAGEFVRNQVNDRIRSELAQVQPIVSGTAEQRT
ncbi:MAG: phosphate acyltransferase PlsX [Acidobacteriota bacterium]